MSLGKRAYEQEKAAAESLAGMAARLGILLFQIFILLLLSTFPFKFWHFSDVRPAFLFMAVYYWAIFRPHTLSPLGAFLSGLLLDLIYATSPLGLNALTLVALQWVTKTQRRFLSGQSFVVLWMCFFLAAGGAFLFQWAVFSLSNFSLMPVKSLLISALLTGLFFPLLSWFLGAFGKGAGRD